MTTTGPYPHGAVLIRGKKISILHAGNQLSVWESLLFRQGFLKVVPIPKELEGLTLSAIMSNLLAKP